jgi:DNA recombination protein RmuC
MDGVSVLAGVAAGFVLAAVVLVLYFRARMAAGSAAALGGLQGELALVRERLGQRGAELEGAREALAQEREGAAEMRRALEHARTELARAETSLGLQERELATLREAQRLAGQEADQLRERLRMESAARASAEEKAQRVEQADERAKSLSESLAEREGVVSALKQRLAQLETTLEKERSEAQEKLALLDQARQSLTEQFKNLANEILEEKAKRFTEQNRQGLEGLLSPLREQIHKFEKQVADTYEKESKDRVSLFHEIRQLKDLNQRISQDAVNLTKALKGESRTQGTWGELVLERVLELSGLERGREYEVQTSFKDEEGSRYRPDVIVHLPEGRDIIIDSKVSLVHYERYCSAEDEDERRTALAQHIASLRTHIRSLGDKAYHALPGVRTLDFVLMFVPIETAYSEALREAPELVTDALGRNIVLVTPMTLLLALRTVHRLWRYEHQSQNAQEIAKRAGDLYDKFVAFIADLESIGKRIGDAQKAYDSAHNKLCTGRGNLVRRAEQIRRLGVSTSKSLPEEIVGRSEVELPALEQSATGTEAEPA